MVKKENDFLAGKCIYEYVKGSWYFKNTDFSLRSKRFHAV